MKIPRMRRMAAAVTLFAALTVSGSILASAEEAPTKPTLKFRPDGTFKIVMFSDVQDDVPIDPRTIDAINKILDYEKPDFVMLAGDNSTGGIRNANAFKEYVKQMVAPMETRKIPWAHVYGNHDEDHLGATGMTKERQQPVYEAFSHSLSQWGPKEVDGVGNFVLPVKASSGEDVVFNIWGLDSGAYLKDNNRWYKGKLEKDGALPNGLQGKEPYDFVKFTQLRWYWDTSVEMEKRYGHKVPGILFIHIPVPEQRMISMNPNETKMAGEQNEDVFNSSINSGLFATVLQRGDIKGVFFGHDHINTFDGTYAGIRLGYDGSIGFGTYGFEGPDKDRLRGARVFLINEKNPWTFETWMRLASEVSPAAPAGQ